MLIYLFFFLLCRHLVTGLLRQNYLNDDQILTLIKNNEWKKQQQYFLFYFNTMKQTIFINNTHFVQKQFPRMKTHTNIPINPRYGWMSRFSERMSWIWLEATDYRDIGLLGFSWMKTTRDQLACSTNVITDIPSSCFNNHFK